MARSCGTSGFSSGSDESCDPDPESQALNIPVDLSPSFADHAGTKRDPLAVSLVLALDTLELGDPKGDLGGIEWMTESC